MFWCSVQILCLNLFQDILLNYFYSHCEWDQLLVYDMLLIFVSVLNPATSLNLLYQFHFLLLEILDFCMYRVMLFAKNQMYNLTFSFHVNMPFYFLVLSNCF